MSSELPVNAQIEPYAGVSEFELPERTRLLATRIIWDLINPCQQQLSNAEKDRDEQLANARQTLNAAISSFEEEKKQINAEAESKISKIKQGQAQKLEHLQSAIRKALGDLQSTCGAAKYHLSSQGLRFEPEPAEVQSSDQPPILDITAFQNAVQTLRHPLKQICDTKLPGFWPKNKEARGALIILSLISCGGVLVLFVIAVFIMQLLRTAHIKSCYSDLIDKSQKLRSELTIADSYAHKNYEAALQPIVRIQDEAKTAIETAKQRIIQAAQETHAQAEIEIQKKFGEEFQKIEDEFCNVSIELHKEADSLWQQSVYAGANWDVPIWQQWSPDPSPEFAARIGTFSSGAGNLQSRFPKIDFTFTLPALIPFAGGRCLLISADGKVKNEASVSLLSVMVRVLANTPPGKARFTFIDPVGLGQNVADFMHLGDLNKDLISGKAWSEPQHIEQQLVLLTEHIEMVIQTCLRREFASIRDYNRERHEVAQPFRFLVVNDFPVNFSESSARRLVSIVKNGPRCGVFAFIIRDSKKTLPHGFNIRDLEDMATQIVFMGEHLPDKGTQIGSFIWDDQDLEDFTLALDEAPPQDLTTTIVKKSGELAISAMKIDVPFEKLLASASLTKASWWSASAAKDLQVPLGPAGVRAIQELSLGGDQEPHALLVGRTGSGKTNLMHVMITGLALKYAPQEVQLYLIDFKGGVGFKRYAECRLPHAKVIAIESEREFGMSVLRDLDAELKKRSDAFRAANVDNLAAYRAKAKSENANGYLMPRILLVVDEFQEFFMENDDLAQQAKIILERLARQGRSYGLHFLLATQSLAGAAQLPAAIMGQIKVRIALPCSEADSRLILADDNKAARSLSQPGEAIYNSLGGLIEGNNRFQVARFSDNDLRTYLAAVSETTRDGHIPIIFEGNELAHVEDCAPLKELLHSQNWPQANKSTDIFLGEPIAIASPVTARFRRQSGANLMILSRDEAEGVGMCLTATLNIIAQQHPNSRRIFIADFATTDSEWAEHAAEIARCFPGEITVIDRQRSVASMLATIAKEVQSRGDEMSGKGSIYLVLQGMHRIKALREDTEDDDGHNAVELLKTILRDGPEVGVHVLAWADTWGNITRGLDRKTIGEFGLRVATVMDSGDSMNFLDNLAASKISKAHRALLYDEDKPGQLLPFRPYAMPGVAWLKETGEQLRARIGNQSTIQSTPV